MLILTKQDMQLLEREIISLLSDVICVDCETNITDNPKERFVVGVAIATADKTYYIPLRHNSPIPQLNKNYTDDLPPDLFDGMIITCHNAKFDIPLLRELGFRITDDQVECTLIQSHLLNENPPHGLDALGLQLFGVGKIGNEHIKEMAKIAKGYEKVPTDAMAMYSEQDAKLGRDLWFKFEPYFKEYRQTWEEIERPFLFLLSKMENQGLLVDVEAAKEKSAQTLERMEQIKEELKFDPAKLSQLRAKLFSQPPDGLGLKPKKTPAGQPATDSDYLESIGHPITALVLEYRACQKARSGYYEPYTRFAGTSQRIHPTFKPWGTVTGRLSCENPNFQQIPRESTNDFIKKLFLAEPGCELWEFDFKAIEYRLACVYSGDNDLINIFRDERDFHSEIANEIGISRDAAKVVNFLTLYGGGASKLASQLRIPLSGADTIIKNYRRRFPALFEVAAKAEQTAEQNKGVVKMWTERKRHFKYQSEYHKAFNAVIQGGAFEIVKRSMLKVDQAGYTTVNQVHDSIWVQLPIGSDITKVQSLMSDWTEEVFELKFTTDAKRLA